MTPPKPYHDAAETLREAFRVERERAAGLPSIPLDNREVQSAFRTIGRCPDRLFPEVLDIIFGDKPEPSESMSGRMKTRSTPYRYKDCDHVEDSRGKLWSYSEPADVWRLRMATGFVSLTSARSWDKLRSEFGPLRKTSRRWPEKKEEKIGAHSRV